MNDRMREEIDNMMQNITFDPAMMQRTRTKYSITHAAKRALALAVAAAILTTGAFALGVSLLQHIRNQMGSFGSQVMPIAATCQTEDEGFEFSVVASLCDGYQATVFVQVKDVVGGRLNQDKHMCFYIEETTGRTGEEIPEWKYAGSFISRAPEVFDEQTQTAIYRVEKPNLCDNLPEANQLRTFQVIIDGIEDEGIRKGFEQEGQKPCAVNVTGIANHVLQMDGNMPVPGQNPSAEIEGMDGIKVSSVGFDSEGVFHTLFEIPEGVYCRKKTRLGDRGGWLSCKPNLPYIPQEESTGNWGFGNWVCFDNDRYNDYIIYGLDSENVPDVVTLNISGSYTKTPRIDVNVVLEPTTQPTQTYNISQTIDAGNGTIIEHAQISTLGLFITHPSYQGPSNDPHPQKAVITMKDGTTYTYMQDDITSRTHWYGKDFDNCIDYWGFFDTDDGISKKNHPITQPLDITQVDKVTINGVEIPFDR